MVSSYQHENNSYPSQSDMRSSGSQDAESLNERFRRRTRGARPRRGPRNVEFTYYTLMVSVNLEQDGATVSSNFVFPVIIPPSIINNLRLTAPNIIRFIRLDDVTEMNPENSTFEFIRKSRIKRKMKEVLRKSRAISFNKTMESKECCICLSEFQTKEKVRKLTCEHIFHKNCIDEWLTNGDICCPICRKVPFEKAAS